MAYLLLEEDPWFQVRVFLQALHLDAVRITWGAILPWVTKEATWVALATNSCEQDQSWNLPSVIATMDSRHPSLAGLLPSSIGFAWWWLSWCDAAATAYHPSVADTSLAVVGTYQVIHTFIVAACLVVELVVATNLDQLARWLLLNCRNPLSSFLNVYLLVKFIIDFRVLFYSCIYVISR